MTWHIDPTTCVSISRSRAKRDSPSIGIVSSHACISPAWSSTQRANSAASPVLSKRNALARVIRSRRTYVRNSPDSMTALAPRCSEMASPPSVLASGTRTSSCARERSSTRPSGSASSYSARAMRSGPTTATGTTATPVSASVALENGWRSSQKTSPSSVCARSASWRARMDSGSFLRGQRGVLTPGSLRPRYAEECDLDEDRGEAEPHRPEPEPSAVELAAASP